VIIPAPLLSEKASKIIGMVCKTTYRDAANEQESVETIS
jgi:hypothetical protein